MTINNEEILLDKILEHIGPVDFCGKAGLPRNGKLKIYHYHTTVIAEVLRIAEEFNLGLCRYLDFICVYNGERWVEIDPDRMEGFLGKAAAKMGVELSRSKFYKFKNELFKQFLSQASLQKASIHQKVLINLKNGTFEITASGRRLRAFDRSDFLTYQLPFAYDPEAHAPLFEAFLKEVLPDESSQMVLAEYIAYFFLSHGTLKLEKVLLLYGKGANGKSVIHDIVYALVGPDNIVQISLQSLTNESGYHRAKLANKLVNYATEISGRLETAFFKQLASGEPIEARLPYGQPFILRNYAKLMFNCNELPREVEHSHAFFRRFIIIPFEVIIPEERQNRDLAKCIIDTELAGIFNWMLRGMDRLLAQKGFTYSDAVVKQVEQYKKESDSVRLFLEDYGYRADTNEVTALSDMYSEYRLFCLDDGLKAVSKIHFRKRLEGSKITAVRRSSGVVVFAKKSSS